MQAVRLTKAGLPLEAMDVPVPRIGEDDVLVRIRAAGICHSDVHYRAGRSNVTPLPMTLGHEIAGTIERAGARAEGLKAGDRVCIHYLVTCGECEYCRSGREQFCPRGKMLGHHADGGYAEFVAVPARNAVPLPPEIPFEQGAILMCSSATAFHALRKSRLRPGETVAVFGTGGLGISAVQIAFVLGALDVYAVDIQEEKLRLARTYGAIPIHAASTDPVSEIRRLTGGRGVDVALELIGLPQTMRQAVGCLAVMGRAVIAGLAGRPLEIDTYRALIGREAEVIGTNDHLLGELETLIEFVRRGRLDLARAVTDTVALEAGAINETLDKLESFSAGIRTVIVPGR